MVFDGGWPDRPCCPYAGTSLLVCLLPAQFKGRNDRIVWATRAIGHRRLGKTCSEFGLKGCGELGAARISLLSFHFSHFTSLLSNRSVGGPGASFPADIITMAFWRIGLLGGFVGASEVRFGLGFCCWNLGVDGASLVVELGAVGIFGDQVVVGA